MILVRLKVAQMCLQSNIKCYEWISTNIFKIFYFSEISTASLTQSLTHSLIRSVKHGRLATATASLLWQKCLEFRRKRTFHIINCLRVCTVLLQFKLWSFFMVAIASQYCCPQRSRAVSHIASGFPHHIIMSPITLWCFLIV